MSQKYKQVTVKQTRGELVEIICDRCGKSITPDDFVEWQEALTIGFRGGYGSVFGDDIKYRCDLCQHCLKETLGEYIKPSKEW